MAITTNAIANSFKKQLLEATHNFSTSGSGGNTFKLAMYTNSATLGKSTTSYTTGNEVSSSGYTAGGSALVNTGTSLATNTAITDFSDLSFTGVTLTARGALIYNEAATSDPSVCVLDFGGDKTSTNGDFTIQFPAADASNAIIRIA